MGYTIKKDIPAKLNLSLVITGRRGEYHTIESVMTSVNLYDTVKAKLNDGKGLNVKLKSDNSDFISALYEQNIRRAADKFTERYGVVNADLEIHNRIKLGAGIGGSTAGVIGVLKCLAELKKVELDVGFLLSVGSDAPFMATGGICFVSGVGEKVEKLDFKKLFFVVLFPKCGIDSGLAYKLYDEINGQISLIDSVRRDDIIKLSFGCPLVNDLEIPAGMLNDEIVYAKETLKAARASKVLMSGSGSAVFAVFDTYDEAKAVFESVKFEGDKLLLNSVEAV